MSAVNTRVNHPSHYTQGQIEAKTYLKDSLQGGYVFYCDGSVKKYMHRWRDKNESVELKIEDLKKAEFWLKELIFELENHDYPTISY
jgi:hypothetical protein